LALYFGVGLLTGTLSDHLMNARNQLQHTLASIQGSAEVLAEMIGHHPDYSAVSCGVSGTTSQNQAFANQEQIRQVMAEKSTSGFPLMATSAPVK